MTSRGIDQSSRRGGAIHSALVLRADGLELTLVRGVDGRCTVILPVASVPTPVGISPNQVSQVVDFLLTESQP